MRISDWSSDVCSSDLPIASLDPESSRKVMETLADINRSDNVTVVVSLHQVDFALKYCSRVVALRDGHVMYDGPAAAVTSALLRGIYGNNTDRKSVVYGKVCQYVYVSVGAVVIN